MTSQSQPNLSHLPPDQRILAQKLLEELDHGHRELFDSLSPHEQSYAIQVLVDISKGDNSKFKNLWEIDYVRRPITIHQFISDPDYFGVVCKRLYPAWRRELEVLFDTENEITEVVITGAIGTGKTTFAVVALAYKLYTLTCLRDPFEYYNLMRGTSSFVFGLFNATRELSDKVHLDKILGAFNSCKYFRWATQGTTDELERETGILKFENNIKLAFGSRALHALGQDIIGGLLDEMNFQQTSETTNQARDLYRNTSRRILSRFPPRLGRKSPGLLFLVSSRKGDTDFLDEYIKNEASHRNVRIISYSAWEARDNDPEIYRSGKWFKVVVGDDRHRSRILEEGEDQPEDYRVIDVPEEHRVQFEQDADGAIMDFAGVSIKGGGRPLIRREKLFECIQYDKDYYPREHPFKTPHHRVVLGLTSTNHIEDEFEWEKIVQCVDPYKKIYRPKINPLAHRYIHLDPATSGDCDYGFAMAHVAGRTNIIRRDPSTMVEYQISAPVIYVDIVLGITHRRGDEIDLSKVRSFIFYLRKLGFPISKITADQFQSVDTLQTFKKHGYEVKRISLDLKPDNYGVTRQCIHEGRLLVYEYDPFVNEIVWLQIDVTDKNKVFTLENRHKDISDAVAGAIASIMEDDKAEQSALEPITVNPEQIIRPRGSIDVTGDWILEGIPGIDHITGVR